MSIITRFPPSPTGYLHIGRARTALFNYLFAKHSAGKMVLRIEDTDKERSKKEYEENIIESMKWFGIAYDDGPYRQSERGDLYKKYLAQLIDSGHAYVSKELVSKEALREEVIRFKNPNMKISFDDLIRGRVEFDTTELGDFVIAKSIDEPLYHLAVVVDDHEMKITHIIRGEDGISNTTRQILIQEGIGASRPFYAHIPLILAPDKSKLSGRHGAISVTEFRNKGYVPEALINYLALLGWNPGTEQEIFSMEELISAFGLEKVQKSGAVFDIEKLNWYNRQYIATFSEDKFSEHSAPFAPEWLSSNSAEFKRIIPVLRSRITLFSDIVALFAPRGELSFIHLIEEYPKESLLWKKTPDAKIAKTHLKSAQEFIGNLSNKEYTLENIKNSIWTYAEQHGKGDVLWPLRVALTGKEKSPDPFTVAFILGREETVKRIENAVAKL